MTSITLSKQQQAALSAVESWYNHPARLDKRAFIINGQAGTGLEDLSRKGGLGHKGKVRVRCKVSNKRSEPSAAKAWLMVLTGAYEYVRKDLQLACQRGLLVHQKAFSSLSHE